MTSPPEAPAAGFAFLEGRLRTAVQVAAAADQTPDDSLRGLYISDEQALSLAAGAAAVDADARMAAAADRLRLDALDTAVLTVCAAPELHRRYGFLYAYLQDDVTRRLASPRLAADLLAGEGVEPLRRARLLRPRRAARRPAARSGSCCPTGRRRSPTARSRSPTAWPRSCSAPTTTSATPARRSRCAASQPHAFASGRDEAVAEVARLLAAETRLPLAVCGPDAAAIVAMAAEAPLILLDVHDLERPRGDGRRDARRRARGPPALPRRSRRPQAARSASVSSARSTSAATARSCSGAAAARRSR